jgi:hypothetical protein
LRRVSGNWPEASNSHIPKIPFLRRDPGLGTLESLT